MVKLNNKRIKWLVKQVVREGKKPKDVAPVYKVSERRVQQLVKEYQETKKFPVLNKSRRPNTVLSERQKQAIDIAYQETKLSTKLLYYELKRRNQYVPKNKIYKYMLLKGWVQPNPKKQKKRKRCRYEWPRTGDMLHADHHRTSEDHPHAIFWIDDRSRMILSGGEFESADSNSVMITFKQAQAKLAELDCSIKRINTDRGTAFISNKKNGSSELEKYCAKKNIQVIPSRPKNPQTNGKVERRWLEYDRHRWRFNSIHEWIEFHNDRLTTALNIEEFETPNDAFYRYLPNLLALFWKRIENE